MSEQSQLIDAFVDMRPNLPKNDHTRKLFREKLLEEFENMLDDVVERVWDLPPLTVKPHGEYLELLTEARELYLFGRFYSCVAMCGIVGERLVKDVFRTSVLVRKDDMPQRPSDAAFDQFEHVEVSGIVRFLKEARLLSAKAAKAAKDLGELRNKYAHARDKAPDKDAIKAIKFLHMLIEGAVSVFKEFEIKNGALVRKAAHDAPSS